MPSATDTSEPMSTAYDPESTEPGVWSKWIDAGAFHADPSRVLSGAARPYAILIPPPNVTAALHLGHALNNTIQDILIRAHRMMGFETLWMPGTDHAGIATQTMVDKKLKSEGKDGIAAYKQKELDGENGREQFIALVQEFKDEYESRITAQLQKMGCSCDWRRQRFTMDEICARAVREAFFRLFRDGLIYRGKRLVNWDPVSQTALADDEVEMHEVEGAFYYLRYPLVHDDNDDPTIPMTWGELARRGYPGADTHPDDEQAWVTVATTRPETYLGDTAVAVNPKDPRAKSVRGCKVMLPLVGRTIPIVEDDYVVLPVSMGGEPGDAKAEMSTGFLKVTPAHDPNDYMIGQRHDLEMINVMAPDASISDQHGWDDVGDAHIFVGKSREDARELVVKEFRARSMSEGSEGSLLEAIKPHTHSVGHSYRSHVPIEPYLSDQWYCKVTDDRLRGSAQRALISDQRTDASLASWPESNPKTGGTGVPPVSQADAPIQRAARNLPHWSRDGATYFVTFTVAHGELSESERSMVLDACFHFHNDRHSTLLATVMPDHVHLLIKPLRKPDDSWHDLSSIMHSIKSFSAHQINTARNASGSVWLDESFDRIVRDQDEFDEKAKYIYENPMRAGLVDHANEYPFTRSGDQDNHRRDACATESTDGSMTFFPARYAKTYETWHDNLRDWCISRQLWWGHRIPVWHRRVTSTPQHPGVAGEAGTLGLDHLIRGENPNALVRVYDERGNELDPGSVLEISDATLSEERSYEVFVCFQNPDDPSREYLEEEGFTQDPDVLDTWFSSALWPLSTLGWPDTDASARDDDRVGDFDALLGAFNPSSVLCTAREIITLWVSRMTMFNRYFRSGEPPQAGGTGVPPVESSPSHRRDACATVIDGPAPFKDVFIHAMIQDGEGRKMSKSLGNGVDPLDIIHTHGADAMRFTLCQMTTQTQDVRMPVEADPETGKNTSPKFDIGRNLCNKLWNASRFALSMLEKNPVHPGPPIDPQEFSLVDRWMLSRVTEATGAVATALRTYQFKDYADTLYDLLWRDLCDWYLESIKPTIAHDENQPAVLRTVLDAVLRLMHPVTPFITESIHERLSPIPHREIIGWRVMQTPSTDTLCQSGWPDPDASLIDAPASEAYGRVRELVSAIRELRAANRVPPKRRIVLHASGALAQDIARWSPLVETLAVLETVTTDRPSGAGASFVFEGVEHSLSGLADELDAGAQRERLEKELADLDASIHALEGRLSNPGYTEKAPAHLVEQTRAELAQKQQDRGSLAAALDALG